MYANPIVWILFKPMKDINDLGYACHWCKPTEIVIKSSARQEEEEEEEVENVFASRKLYPANLELR